MAEKIILINPSYSDSLSMIRGSAWMAMPMGLLYLAAALEREGHAVKVIDMQISGSAVPDIKAIIEKEKPSFVGITAVTAMINRALVLCKIVKEINQDIYTLLGGSHPTALPMETINHQAVDIVISGEGEVSICEVVDFLSKHPGRIGEVKGIYYKKEGSAIFAGERKVLEDLDSLPFPAWHLVDLKSYRHPLARSNSFASVLTSRGCPRKCTFCSRGVFANTYRMRSAGNVLEEISRLMEKFDVNEIHFVDDTFTLDRKHIEGICRGIIDRSWKLRWATPNGVQVNTLDEELLLMMKRAGCYSLSFGVESGNQETLDSVKKGQKLEKIKQVFDICHRIGIETVAFIIIGFPNEGRKEIDQTLRFLKEIRADIADIHLLIPLPGTELFEQLNAKGYIIERDWSKYVFHSLPVYRTDHFSQIELFDQYKRVYREYHLRISYIISRLMRLRSLPEIRNHLGGFLTLLKMQYRSC
ncbi:B12-binding domain-containing radical SAM protein [Candidatus Omnitrophota bacterium]